MGTKHGIDMKTGRMVALSRRYRDRKGVKLEISGGATLIGFGNGDLRVHSARDNKGCETKVTTYCGLEKFVTYAQGSGKPVDCLECLARGG